MGSIINWVIIVSQFYLKNVIALFIYVKNWVYAKKDRNWNWMSWTYKSWCSFENGYFVTKKKSEHDLFTS